MASRWPQWPNFSQHLKHKYFLHHQHISALFSKIFVLQRPQITVTVLSLISFPYVSRLIRAARSVRAFRSRRLNRSPDRARWLPGGCVRRLTGEGGEVERGDIIGGALSD